MGGGFRVDRFGRGGAVVGQANFYVPPDCLMRCQPCSHNNPSSLVDFDPACELTSELTVYMLTYSVKGDRKENSNTSLILSSTTFQSYRLNLSLKKPI